MTRSVLFVCLGNICRSPAAEAVFAARTAERDLAHDSAGTSGWHIGDPPYGPMIATARARGIAMDHLRARAFDGSDFGRFDLILGMDADNIAAIERQRPAGSGTIVRRLMDYAPELGIHDVPDPYYSRDFAGALDLIEAGVDGLIRAIRAI